MLAFLLLFVFALGYICIAFEKPLKLNKAASALITGVLCWTIFMVSDVDTHLAGDALSRHMGNIASILFFLLSAMTIVEVIDSHNGFEIITQKIATRNKRSLLIIISVITFFLSALLDNLTTAIVMTSLCSKLLTDKEDKLWFGGMIVIAANAGGAWSPLGDVTTTMLWIGGQITALHIMKELIVPSFMVCLLPLLTASRKFKGKTVVALPVSPATKQESKEGRIILFAGIGLLIAVPVFKTLTQLPPFMGMLLALGMMWVITSIIHRDKQNEDQERFNVASALQKIDAANILFFLGILLAVTALQSSGLLKSLATALSETFTNFYLVGSFLGFLSAIVDNVPLVSASQGMFDFATYPPDHPFWHFLALTTGTGGSMIIIGSAAGIAVMGIQQVDFMWYLKKISWLAFIGFLAGIAAFSLQQFL